MTKRGNGEGTIRKRVDDRWEGRIYTPGPDGALKWKAVYGKTQKEAREKLDALKADVARGMVIAERQPVAQFLDRWLEETARPTVRAKTFQGYALLIHNHLKPALGHHQLSKLSPQDVQAMMNAKLAGGLSPRSVQLLRAMLRRALGYALKWGLVTRNVATLVDSPRGVRAEMLSFTPAEATQFLAAIKGDRLEALYATTLILGLRQGEVLGLRWEDIDFERRTLRVHFALQWLRGQQPCLVEPKTRQSRRTLPLPAMLVEQLRAHRARQEADTARPGRKWIGDEWGLVFCTHQGRPLNNRHLVTYFKAILRRADLPNLRFHDLRHSCASLLVAHGLHPRVIMEQLGHSTITLTMNTYAHVIPDLQRQAANMMDEMFGTLAG
jgi:integrase